MFTYNIPFKKQEIDFENRLDVDKHLKFILPWSEFDYFLYINSYSNFIFTSKIYYNHLLYYFSHTHSTNLHLTRPRWIHSSIRLIFLPELTFSFLFLTQIDLATSV